MNEPTKPEHHQLSLFLEHRIEEIERASHAVNAFCAEHEVADRDHSAIQVVIDELLMNVVSYAFPADAVQPPEDRTQPIQVSQDATTEMPIQSGNDATAEMPIHAIHDATAEMPIQGGHDATAEMPIGSSPSETPKVLFELTLVPGHLHVTIVDNGKAFDPFALNAPDIDAEMDDRPIGGLGVHLVRKLMDKAHYERSEGRNILRLSRRLLDDDSPSAENWSVISEESSS